MTGMRYARQSIGIAFDWPSSAGPARLYTLIDAPIPIYVNCVVFVNDHTLVPMAVRKRLYRYGQDLWLFALTVIYVIATLGTVWFFVEPIEAVRGWADLLGYPSNKNISYSNVGHFRR